MSLWKQTFLVCDLYGSLTVVFWFLFLYILLHPGLNIIQILRFSLSCVVLISPFFSFQNAKKVNEVIHLCYLEMVKKHKTILTFFKVHSNVAAKAAAVVPCAKLATLQKKI